MLAVKSLPITATDAPLIRLGQEMESAVKRMRQEIEKIPVDIGVHEEDEALRTAYVLPQAIANEIMRGEALGADGQAVQARAFRWLDTGTY